MAEVEIEKDFHIAFPVFKRRGECSFENFLLKVVVTGSVPFFKPCFIIK